jgi:hypothetical protein
MIRVLRNVNPHRPGSLDRRRWDLIRDGMFVGEFITQHNLTGPLAAGGLGDRWHAVRYLRYMVERGGFIELPGVVFPTRVPRGPRELLPLSSDLSGFTVGIEFECIMPGDVGRPGLTEALTARGTNTRWVNSYADHDTHPHWTVAGDLSLPRFQGAEVKSPILRGQDGMEQVMRVARALKELGCKVTRRCGLHVHVGIENENADFFRNLLRVYYNNSRLIDRLVPASRRGNYHRFARQASITQLRDDMTKEQILRGWGNQKFVKVNLSNYATRGTVEFRQGGPTVEADKAAYWVKLMLRLCAAARAGRGTQPIATLEEFLTVIGCAEDERNFLLRRAATLAPLPAQSTGAVA